MDHGRGCAVFPRSGEKAMRQTGRTDRKGPSRHHAEAVRAFVAIELPSEVHAFCRDAMERARRRLGPAAGAVRWVEPAGIHLTLKFLGAVPAAQVPRLVERLQSGLADQAGFELAAGTLGVFPEKGLPRVIWLATVGDLAALGICQQRVERALEPLGFPPERRAFAPHLTLGRVRETARPEETAVIAALPAAWPPGTSPPFRVTTASLMRSELAPGGARYTRLAVIPFAGGG